MSVTAWTRNSGALYLGAGLTVFSLDSEFSLLSLDVAHRCYPGSGIDVTFWILMNFLMYPPEHFDSRVQRHN